MAQLRTYSRLTHKKHQRNSQTHRRLRSFHQKNGLNRKRLSSDNRQCRRRVPLQRRLPCRPSCSQHLRLRQRRCGSQRTLGRGFFSLGPQYCSLGVGTGMIVIHLTFDVFIVDNIMSIKYIQLPIYSVRSFSRRYRYSESTSTSRAAEGAQQAYPTK